jgi:myo-inositol-1(or 4)-monophosphatase
VSERSLSAELLALAEAAALEAGELLVGRFRRPPTGVDAKSTATDLVSDADLDAEAAVRSRIRAARPADAILGEERGERGGGSGLRWVVDPLDGTVNYLFGLPAWSVSIACEDDRGPLVGVVRDPLQLESFTAVRGGGAALNGRPIACSDTSSLATAMIATCFSYRRDEREVQARALAIVLPTVRDIRRIGSAALDLAMVACGRVDGYYETGPAHWDLAAGSLLVTEAGGVVSSLPAVGPSGDGVVAAGPHLHDALSELVSGTPQRSREKNSLH